ncbi:MAG: RagB/SusD family nutrient uptake outer membrane protein [Gemmatimonadetes bacterium]|nr:RagB/SusD family nutrient uptake outer membrane protein [Gemmatimonadota bacterium]
MTIHPNRGFTRTKIAAAVLLCAAVAACDVTNPGPVQDEFLALPASQQGLVNGAIRRFAEAVSWEAYTSGLVAREVFPGGQTGAHGHDVLTQGGYIQPGSYGGYFNDAQQARFIAETAITRFTEVKASNNLMYQAHLWAAYAYRNLGENWCEAVIDGGPLLPGKTYFDKAIENFGKALTYAATDNEKRQVLGARAAAYAWLNDWPKVIVDAAQLPDTYVFNLNLDQADQDTENHVYFAIANSPYRAYTIWKTWFETYYTDTGDPRTPWTSDAKLPFANASLQGYGQVPFTYQTKYKTRNDDQRLTSGWEMRLLEAEAKLIASDIPGAMALINKVRTRNVSTKTGQALAPWVANSSDEAWTALKRERMVELWLEGRRLGDQRRWAASNRPGSIDLPNFEAVSTIFKANPRSLCFDIPDSERNANTNF